MVVQVKNSLHVFVIFSSWFEKTTKWSGNCALFYLRSGAVKWYVVSGTAVYMFCFDLLNLNYASAQIRQCTGHKW